MTRLLAPERSFETRRQTSKSIRDIRYPCGPYSQNQWRKRIQQVTLIDLQCGTPGNMVVRHSAGYGTIPSTGVISDGFETFE